MSSTKAFHAYRNISIMLLKDIKDTLKSMSIAKGKICEADHPWYFLTPHSVWTQITPTTVRLPKADPITII